MSAGGRDRRLTAGFGFLTQAAASGLAAVVTGSAVFGLELAPVTNLVVGLMLGSAPPAGRAASGLSEASTEFGGALGIAVLGSVGAAVYHSRVTGHIPRGIPGPAARAVSATLGDATRPRGSCTGRPRAPSSQPPARPSRALWTWSPASARSSRRRWPWLRWHGWGVSPRPMRAPRPAEASRSCFVE